MQQMKITGSRLALPRVFDNDVAIAPETASNVHLAMVNFDLGSAVVKRNQSETSTEIAVGMMLAGRENSTFACLFLDVPSAKALAQKLLEMTA
jgi:hypothetical protein